MHYLQQGFSKDDEYVAIVFAMREDTGELEQVKELLPSIYRSFERVQHQGLIKSIMKDAREVFEAGVGSDHAGDLVTVDLHRVRRVMARTVRGLCWHEQGQRLADSHCVVLATEDDLRGTLPADTTAALLSAQPVVIGKNVFSYRHVVAADEPMTSAWVLTVFGKVPFFGLTLPRDRVEPELAL